jgi:ArsR family transcriptional regulator, arsenate/arsenite/antimonite-responsive transcriptional repressor
MFSQQALGHLAAARIASTEEKYVGFRHVVSLRYFQYYRNMELRQAVAALTALAQETRLRIFRLLVPCGETGVPAGEIAEQLDIPSATLTFHLKELVNAGLIESRREGRSIIYSLHVKGMQQLMTFLAKDCCQGQPELCVDLVCNPAVSKKRTTKSVRKSI